MNTKKWISLALASCALFFLTPAAFAQTCGLISNSGFESDLAGWSGSGPVSIVADARSGTKAARVGTAQGWRESLGVVRRDRRAIAHLPVLGQGRPALLPGPVSDSIF